MYGRISCILTISAIAVILTACSVGYQEGILQKDEVSYFRFTGDVAGAVVSIDSGETIYLGLDSQGKPANVIYKVAPGKHRVVVTKGNQVVVDRIVIVDNQNTREIQVP